MSRVYRLTNASANTRGSVHATASKRFRRTRPPRSQWLAVVVRTATLLPASVDAPREAVHGWQIHRLRPGALERPDQRQRRQRVRCERPRAPEVDPLLDADADARTDSCDGQDRLDGRGPPRFRARGTRARGAC